jgi:hypothetical protein
MWPRNVSILHSIADYPVVSTVSLYASTAVPFLVSENHLGVR